MSMDADDAALDTKLYALLVVSNNDLINRMQRLMEVFAWVGFELSNTIYRVGKDTPFEISFEINNPGWMERPDVLADYVTQYFKFSILEVTWRPWRAKTEDRLFDAYRFQRDKHFYLYPDELRRKVGTVRLCV